MDIESRLFEEFQLQRKQPEASTHEIWIRRLPALVPTILYNRKGHATKVRMTNVSSRVSSCPAHFPILLWLPHELLPRDEGYVRIGASKYRDWQVLAYEHIMDKQLFRTKQRLYAEWLRQQSPAVERLAYEQPTDILRWTGPVDEYRT